MLSDQSVAPEAAEEMDSEGCDMRLKFENGRNLLRGRPCVLEPFKPSSASEVGKAIKAGPAEARSARPGGISSPIRSAPLSVKNMVPPRQSKPTELRTPQATRRRSDPSWFMLTIVLCSPRGKQMLQGDPNET
nr:hypothetical protein [Mesorhizobium ciceri]